MFIDINTLGPEGLAFDRVIHLRGLEGPSQENLEDVEAHVSGSVVPDAGEAALTARVEATLNLLCGRCLEPFPWTARTEVDLRLVRAPKQDPECENVAPEGKLELEGMVTEQLYLGLPLKPVCRPDCRGLCPVCGANRNTDPCDHDGEPVDPRLAPLLRFRQRKSRES